ncbi:MAG: SIMPL domain-containing protein, partial [Planctomycetes bacterium]|nr:SIMPL domain-containing protein [Planctomycetota bacterium]
RIGDEERAKLLADAFANAKADAGRMAAAAGVQLGDLASLSSHTTGPDENFSRYSYAYGSRFYQVMQQARAMMSPESEDREAVGIEPKKITHRVVMMASFRLK